MKSRSFSSSRLRLLNSLTFNNLILQTSRKFVSREIFIQLQEERYVLRYFFGSYGCVAHGVFLPSKAVHHIQLLFFVITINFEFTNIVFAAQIIMDISNFFNSSSKKKDLSDQSCNAEEAKKVTEGSSYIYSSYIFHICFIG